MQYSKQDSRKLMNLVPLQFNSLSWIGFTVVGFMSSLVWVQIGEVDDLKLLQAMIGVTIIACFQALVLSRFKTPLRCQLKPNMTSL